MIGKDGFILDNPFIENGFLLPNASVNKLKIKKISNIDDKNILNKHAMDLFSSSILSDSIRSFLLQHKINFGENNMFSIFKEHLRASEDSALCIEANGILKRLGKNLACILLALYEGLEENKSHRDDWDNRHWDYWHNIKKVILCGGMMQDIIGEKIVRYANEFFSEIGIHPYQISVAVSNLPIIGACKCASLKSENSVVFDFGHSYIKRCFYTRDNDSFLIKTLASIKSQHLDLDEDPRLLDDFLLNTIVSTLKEMPPDKIQGSVIAASIANYIHDGDIYEKRGNYSKLKKLTPNTNKSEKSDPEPALKSCQKYAEFYHQIPNYQKYLSSRLKEKLGMDIEIILIHDGSSAAYAINEERCAVLTLGTAIGVGFTYENFDFRYKMV